MPDVSESARRPSSAHPAGSLLASGVGEQTVSEVLAQCLIAVYVVLKFGPFDVIRTPPGVLSSVVFPTMCLIAVMLADGRHLKRLPVSLSLIGLATWLVLTYAWTRIPYSTAYLLRRDVPPLLAVTFVVGLLTPKVVARTVVWVFCALTCWGLLSSLLLPASRRWVEESGQPGFVGTFPHKNQFGIFAVFTLCLVLAFLRNRPRLLMTLVCIGSVIGTRSATAGSGLFAVLFVWFWIAAIDTQKSQRDRSLLRFLSLASFVSGVLLAVGLLPVLLNLYDKDLTFSGRTTIWRESLVTIGRQPWQGYGFGGVWNDGRAPLTQDLHRRIGFPAAHAHNGAIELLLEAGVIGLALFVLFLAQVIVVVVYCLRRPRLVAYGRWGLVTCVSLLLMSLSEPLFLGSSLGLLAIVWAGLANARADDRRTVNSLQRVRRASTVQRRVTAAR